MASQLGLPPACIQHQFLSAPELVLCVLSYLPAHDLLAVSRANKYLRATIRQSSILVSRLADGPTKHYSDLPAHEWNLQNLRLNTNAFPGWNVKSLFPHKVALLHVPNVSRASFAMRVWHPGTRLLDPRRDEQLRLHFDWSDFKAGDFFDPIRNRRLPIDTTVRRLIDTQPDCYPTDPPVPITISCCAIQVSRTPILCEPHDHTRAYPRSYRDVSVQAHTGPCTFGEMIKLTFALAKSPPKGWNSKSEELEWRPWQDYPDLVNIPDFKEAIAMIQVWPVIYKRSVPIPVQCLAPNWIEMVSNAGDPFLSQ